VFSVVFVCMWLVFIRLTELACVWRIHTYIFFFQEYYSYFESGNPCCNIMSTFLFLMTKSWSSGFDTCPCYIPSPPKCYFLCLYHGVGAYCFT